MAIELVIVLGCGLWISGLMMGTSFGLYLGRNK